VSLVGGRPCNNTDAAYLAFWLFSLDETRTKKLINSRRTYPYLLEGLIFAVNSDKPQRSGAVMQ